MSLLNQVLRDLDKRHASDLERIRIPAHVRPLPPAAAPAAKPKWVAAAALGAALAIAILVWVLASRDPAPVSASIPAPREAAAPIAPIAPRPSGVTPDADVVAQALEAERLNAARAMKDSVPAQAPAPRAEPVSPKPEAAKAEPSPQESSGSIRGLPLAATGDGNGGSKIEVTPKGASSESETRRAVNMMERGLKAEPEAILRQVLIAEPAYQPARSALFRLLAASGRQEEGAALLADGLRLNASNTQWAMNLARLQVERGDNAGAWETLQHTLPFARALPDYRAFCGTVLTRVNRPTEAADHYRAALRTRPDEGRWWVGLGVALEADNKAPEARDAFLRAQATGSLPPELATFVEGKLRK